MIQNVHERVVDAPADKVAPLLDGLATPRDPLWPSPAWWPVRLDGPLAVGADGGHGNVRYRVSEYEPGHRVRFELDPRTGLVGHHELSIHPVDGSRTRLRHVLVARLRGAMRVLGPTLVVPLHDALIEDLLDNAERAATGTVRAPARWSGWVRLWQRVDSRVRARAGDPLPGAELVAEVLRQWAPADLVDAWTVPRWPGHPADPQAWADAVFRDPPGWVRGLLALRQALVPLVGIERGSATSFAALARTGEEVLLGEDAGHLDFRASVHVADEVVTLTTVARATNLRGRAYLVVVRRVHPPVVRGMLVRAHRRLGLAAPRG